MKRHSWLLLAFVATGCTSDEPAPTLEEIQLEVLNKSCGFSSCHDGGSYLLDLSTMEASMSMVNQESERAANEIFVIPGDPDNSYLVKKLEGASGIVDEPMPPPAGGLDESKIAMVRDWIAAGALTD
tara:strand:+ start:247 stop:627 length:381 start_codon:yes stop_codon:yes gene_type:complete